MATADEKIAERLGRALDSHLAELTAEKARLLAAPVRIADIDAELVILQSEKLRIDPRRPPQSPLAPSGTVVDAPAPVRVR
jgi:hypothetical protein